MTMNAYRAPRVHMFQMAIFASVGVDSLLSFSQVKITFTTIPLYGCVWNTDSREGVSFIKILSPSYCKSAAANDANKLHSPNSFLFFLFFFIHISACACVLFVVDVIIACTYGKFSSWKCECEHWFYYFFFFHFLNEKRICIARLLCHVPHLPPHALHYQHLVNKLPCMVCCVHGSHVYTTIYMTPVRITNDNVIGATIETTTNITRNKKIEESNNRSLTCVPFVGSAPHL